jgi:hypothetical protein
VNAAHAQVSAAGPNPAGVWRGTSLCTVRPSPCHDEVVVYYITRVNGSDSLTLDARKIVNGQEDPMGVLGCHLDAPAAQITCTMRNGVWHFTIRGDSLVGDLRLPDNTKYRDVRVARSPSPGSASSKLDWGRGVSIAALRSARRSWVAVAAPASRRMED